MLSHDVPEPVKDLPLPPQGLRFMSEPDDLIVQVGQHLASILRRHGLREDDRLLDVGSGYGRLAIGLITTDFRGRYVGFEILEKQVKWCRRKLTPLTQGQYRFRHHNVRNSRYNPKGDLLAHEARFPVKRRAFDYCCLFSVFTHMYEADIRNYLEEIRRSLKPGGRALTTWFLFDDERLPSVVDPAKTRFPMVNLINAVTRYSEPVDPLRAIAYEESFVRSMVSDAGLEIVTLERGNWCGDAVEEFQDILVLRAAPVRTVSPLRARLGRARRALARRVRRR